MGDLNFSPTGSRALDDELPEVINISDDSDSVDSNSGSDDESDNDDSRTDDSRVVISHTDAGRGTNTHGPAPTTGVQAKDEETSAAEPKSSTTGTNLRHQTMHNESLIELEPIQRESHLDGNLDKVAEQTQMRARLDQKRLDRGSGTTDQPKKRKRDTMALPEEVNVTATRAWITWDDQSDTCMYTWKRGQSGRCWVTEAGRDTSGEVEGEYLLLAGSALTVEIRANFDWLPIKVQWNGHGFEGCEEIDGKTLQIGAEEMIDMVCGGKGQHVGLVFQRST